MFFCYVAHQAKQCMHEYNALFFCRNARFTFPLNRGWVHAESERARGGDKVRIPCMHTMWKQAAAVAAMAATWKNVWFCFCIVRHLHAHFCRMQYHFYCTIKQFSQRVFFMCMLHVLTMARVIVIRAFHSKCSILLRAHKSGDAFNKTCCILTRTKRKNSFVSAKKRNEEKTR